MEARISATRDEHKVTMDFDGSVGGVVSLVGEICTDVMEQVISEIGEQQAMGMYADLQNAIFKQIGVSEMTKWNFARTLLSDMNSGKSVLS